MMMNKDCDEAFVTGTFQLEFCLNGITRGKAIDILRLKILNAIK